MLRLGLKSLLNRRFVSLLTVVSIALSVCLIVGVERLRAEARAGFANSASGIDLIVASRGNPVQILLATVFGVGSTGNALTWDTFEDIRAQRGIAWAVPLSMGDNHRGFPVIGTIPDYFTHFRHSGGQALELATGRAFSDATEAVLGAEVARRLGYGEGAEIVLAHGSGDVAFHVHDDEPFTVVGVLEPTGTAVDRMVLVSLQGFDALHGDAPAGEATARDALLGVIGRPDARNPKAEARVSDQGQARDGHNEHHEHDDHAGHDHDEHADHDHDESADHDHDHGHDEHDGHDHAHDRGEAEVRQINAVYLGLRDRTAVLGLQRTFSDYEAEPLTAVMPNVALLELWSLTGTAEAALGLMAVAVALAGMLGLLATLSAALESRRREFAVLRSVGATPWRIFALIVLEALLLTLAGLVLGYLVLMAALALLDPILATELGLRLTRWWPSTTEAALMLAVLVAGLVASLVPGFRVYRITLADGLSSGH